jgi:hypothetical protein
LSPGVSISILIVTILGVSAEGRTSTPALPQRFLDEPLMHYGCCVLAL